MEKKFLDYIASVFGVDPSTISMETSYGSIPQWDSLMQLCIVAGLLDEFNVDIPINEVANIKTLGDFYKYFEN